MLEKMRWRLTLGYAGIFALILIFLAMAAVAGFSRELTSRTRCSRRRLGTWREIYWTVITGRS